MKSEEEKAAMERTGEDVAASRNEEVEEVRRQLLETLASRRGEAVPLSLLPSTHVDTRFLQREGFISERTATTIASAALKESAGSGEKFQEENLLLHVEAGKQGHLPVLILAPRPSQCQDETGIPKARPAVIFLHWTGADKMLMRPYMKAFAERGYVAVAIDSRYHGERANSVHSYSDALISAWKTGQEMPFIFDTVWDLVNLMDYLTGRPDICSKRIGVLGISLGGMNAWFGAAADPRIAAVVCLIGVQSFSWAVTHDQWKARVATIPAVFRVASEDLGKSEVDGETVAAVWRRIAPGLMDKFDVEQTLPAIVPRPLLIMNGLQDPRCPVDGLEKAITKTAAIYQEAGVPHHFKFVAEKGVGHSVTQTMAEEARSWLHRHLSGPL